MLNLFFTTGKGDFAGKSFKVFQSNQWLPRSKRTRGENHCEPGEDAFLHCCRASHCGESERGEEEKVGFVHGHICMKAGPGVENTNGVGKTFERLKSAQRQFSTCLD